MTKGVVNIFIVGLKPISLSTLDQMMFLYAILTIQLESPQYGSQNRDLDQTYDTTILRSHMPKTIWIV